ncbi:hypothetical protein [Roseococcus sp.]|uniref:hypothetical protein n=1 Tax=Roseococcus sp. TaxID=2109646 RepID=UPI003BA8D660
MIASEQMLTVRVPLAHRKQGGRKLVVAPAGGVLHVPARMEMTLAKALARAFRWRRLLREGRYNSLEDLAAKEGISPSYVSRVLRLTLLAPVVIEAILEGRQQDGLSLAALMQPFPVCWVAQGDAFGTRLAAATR